MVFLAAAGFAAGSVNAVAGGGTFFSFAALLAAGLPSVSANATSALDRLIGALIPIRIGNDTFSAMVPWLLLVATVLFAAGMDIVLLAVQTHP